MFKNILLLSALVLFSSCGGIQKLAINTVASILYDATYEVEGENNWEHFRQAIPANLKLMEGLLFLDPDNIELLVSVIKGYTGQAFTVNETLYLDDYLAENDNLFNKEQAIYNYSRAVNYGINFLKENDIEYSQLVAKTNQPGAEVVNFLDDNLDDDEEELEAVLFTAQSLSGLINLQKDKIALVAQLPVAKAMFDWVCGKKPDINVGACDIFYGAYEAGRPRSLGGNPSKGKEIFIKAIDKWPDNWLVRVAYVQFYLIPMMDEKGYQEQVFYLEKYLRDNQKKISWSYQQKPPKQCNRKVRLYQAIALKRYKIIKKYAKEIF